MATTCGFINRKREEAVTNVKLSMRWEFAATMKSNQIKVNGKEALRIGGWLSVGLVPEFQNLGNRSGHV
ncbi:hypothetical protein T01_309 [Trichinella spiralis]|uniref:Uncharacterized protein n=1 Tax=Trichinella spiralis TaxID=6334 RepID=A0A0V1B8E5_TRISP|nr:hypothetical protein T01_309 [Trichinella spiralis]